MFPPFVTTCGVPGGGVCTPPYAYPLSPCFHVLLFVADAFGGVVVAPIGGVDAGGYEKTATGPVDHAANVAVFHRVEMHVIHVRLKISFVANQVFPISALPDGALLPLAANFAAPLGFRDGE